MDVVVIGVEYTETGKIGDFEWMLLQPQYKNAIFLYCDVETALFSDDCEYGYANLRKYIKLGKTVPITICTLEEGCYSCLNIYNKMIIEAAFSRIKWLIQNNSVDTVFYPIYKQVDETNYEIRILNEHPFVHADVISFIMKKINSISISPIRMMIKKRSNTI